MTTIFTRDSEFDRHIAALTESYTAPELPSLLNPVDVAVATLASIYEVLLTPGQGFLTRAFKGVVAM